MAAESIAWKVSAWLATYALHSTFWIAATWLAAILLSRVSRWRDLAAGIREWMWKLALLGGLATASAQAGFSIQTWRLQWFPVRAEQELAYAPAYTPAIAAPGTVDPLIAPAILQLRTLEAVSLEPAVQFQPAALAVETTPDRPMPWLQLVLAAWLVGVAIGLVRWSREWRRLHRCVRGRVPIESGLVFRDLEALRQRAGYTRRVRLSMAPGIAAPLTMGILRAEICVPPRALRALQRDEIRAVLAHELAHAVRNDTAWLCLCRLLEIAFFFQPLNRVARRLLQEDVESLCDDWAVVHTGECVPLASSLTEIAGWIVGEHRQLPAPAMVVHGSALSHRVRRLLDEERAPVVLRGRAGLTAIASLCCAGAALALPGISTPASADSIAALQCDDDCDAGGEPDAACADCTMQVSPEPADRSAGSLSGVIATAAPALVLPLDLSSLVHEIDSLEHNLDELQAQVTLFGAHEMQPQVDTLRTRLESLRAMRARLYELLPRAEAWRLLDQP